MHLIWLALACSPDSDLREQDTGSVDTTLPATTPSTSTAPAIVVGRTRYDGVRHGPLTSSVVDAMQEIASRGDGGENAFMKVGDSITVDRNALSCFSGDQVDLADDQVLEATRAWFEGSWDRDSEAAEGARTAAWSLDGPVTAEADLFDPRYALVQFGTNDMQMGTTHESAIWAFGSNMRTLGDLLADRGIIPIFSTIPHRTDLESAEEWVPIYNTVVRGVAQGLQSPIMDLHGALREVDGFGLRTDGVHLSAFDSSLGCNFTPDGLEYGNNIRNRLWLESLDRVLAARQGGPLEPDDLPSLQGAGTPDDPFIVDQLPATWRQNTANSAVSEIDSYPGCDADQDESGPEQVFHIELASDTRLRAFVFDAVGVDVDLHLMDDTGSPEGCIVRDHQLIDENLEAGEYRLIVDSYVDDGVVLSGDYMLVLYSGA